MEDEPDRDNGLPSVLSPSGDLDLDELSYADLGFASFVQDGFPDLSSLSEEGQPDPETVALFHDHGALEPVLSGHAQDTAMEEFFRLNGAWRPCEPCNHCRQSRLQCFSLQTTSDNPIPVTACSSCVALFRECSLSGSGKRSAASFETSYPVAGHLHGILEDTSVVPDGPRFPVDVHTRKETTDKRSTSRSKARTRLLRTWLARHQNDPYPSDQDKNALAGDSGLTVSQVSNWFNNARRRQRVAAQAADLSRQKLIRSGSPMPQPTSEAMTPFERWRNSPPDQEHVSPSVLQAASEDPSLGSIGRGSRSRSQSCADFFLFQARGDTTSQSSSSASSLCSQGSSSSMGSFNASTHARSRRPSRTGGKAAKPSFQCTFCHRPFSKKSDWTRHETTQHRPELNSWICSDLVSATESRTIWRTGESNAECVYSGAISPDSGHFISHEFDACAERAVSERTFNRKDHLWQHLQKFHHCRKWPGWSLEVRLNALHHVNDDVHTECGFCGLELSSWRERTDHIGKHFSDRLTMAQWR